MNMCVHGQTKKAASKDVAYIVVRQSIDNQEGWEKYLSETPVAIFAYKEDADDMAASYTQEMKDREITTLTFYVIATAFYD
jgi:hypothetical protein